MVRGERCGGGRTAGRSTFEVPPTARRGRPRRAAPTRAPGRGGPLRPPFRVLRLPRLRQAGRLDSAPRRLPALRASASRLQAAKAAALEGQTGRKGGKRGAQAPFPPLPFPPSPLRAPVPPKGAGSKHGRPRPRRRPWRRSRLPMAGGARTADLPSEPRALARRRSSRFASRFGILVAASLEDPECRRPPAPACSPLRWASSPSSRFATPAASARPEATPAGRAPGARP
jgi:hypothetical protein